MGLTNCFPGWFKGPLYRRSQMPGIIKLSEIRSEPVTTFSLNEHSSKLVSKFVSLDPCANAVVRPQQRRFFVSWMSVSTDTHRWSEHTACQQSARQQTEHLYQPLRLWGGGHKKTLRVGVGEGQREGVFWPCQGCCTPQLTAYTRLAHDHACQHFSMEWEQTHEPLPGTEELHMDK